MLKKLYKHEFISLYRILLPLYALLVGLSAITRLLSEIGNRENEILSFWKNFTVAISIITLIGIFVVGFVVIIVRFYQNLLSKQGYLTNTLPFKAHNHIFCKLICGVIVEISNVVVALLSLVVMVGTKDNLQKIWSFIKIGTNAFFKAMGTTNAVLLIIEYTVIFILSLCTSILMYYASMAIGQQFKNKILSSVLAYFCIYVAIQFINTLLLTFTMVLGLDMGDEMVNISLSVTTLSQGLTIFVFAVVLIQGIVYYLITNHFLSKKLNLE